MASIGKIDPVTGGVLAPNTGTNKLPVAKIKRRGEGLRVRFARVPGETPADVLRSPLWLPAVIGNFTFEESALHSEYDTVSAGQFSSPAQGDETARQLRTTDLDTLTVEWDPSWLVQRGLDPARVRRDLYAILRSKKPVELLATLQLGNDDVDPELRMRVTIRSIRREMRSGEADTRYYTLSLSEWRDPSIERRGHQESRKPGVKLPTTHRLDANDTLQSLAHEFYGRYDRWRWIRDANGISPKSAGAKTTLVHLVRYKVGSKVKIPKTAVKSVKAG